LAQAQEADKLPNYVPVMPQIKAREPAVDPQKGYLVKQVKPDVYAITDGIYQAAPQLAFFGTGLLGTAALPLAAAPLKWVADQEASGAMPSLRVQTFDFDDVPRAHSLIERDRALGRFVVRV
jgi:hypothetical protein